MISVTSSAAVPLLPSSIPYQPMFPLSCIEQLGSGGTDAPNLSGLAPSLCKIRQFELESTVSGQSDLRKRTDYVARPCPCPLSV